MYIMFMHVCVRKHLINLNNNTIPQVRRRLSTKMGADFSH